MEIPPGDMKIIRRRFRAGGILLISSLPVAFVLFGFPLYIVWDRMGQAWVRAHIFLFLFLMFGLMAAYLVLFVVGYIVRMSSIRRYSGKNLRELSQIQRREIVKKLRAALREKNADSTSF